MRPTCVYRTAFARVPFGGDDAEPFHADSDLAAPLDGGLVGQESPFDQAGLAVAGNVELEDEPIVVRR
jgi:hypothetical protein